jgi:hypothetical protein
MLAFYLDEDTMNRNLARAMQSHGLDVVSPSDAGMIRRSDEEHLTYASQNKRVLYSFNVADYCRLHAEWRNAGTVHAGILLAHQWRRHSVGTQLRGMLRLATQASADEMRSRLEYLSDWI